MKISGTVKYTLLFFIANLALGIVAIGLVLAVYMSGQASVLDIALGVVALLVALVGACGLFITGKRPEVPYTYSGENVYITNDTAKPVAPMSTGQVQEAVSGYDHSEDIRIALNHFAEGAASGKLDARLDPSKFNGEWAESAKNFNAALDELSAPIEIMTGVMTAMKEGDFHYRVTESHHGMLKETVDTINNTMEIVASYIDELDRVLDDIAEGNLQGRIERQYVGTFDLIKRSVNSILMRLNDTMQDIEAVSEGVSSGALMLSKSSVELSSGVQAQMQSVDKLAQEVKEIDDKLRENVSSAKQASDISLTTMRSAETGNSDMKLLLESMEKISDSSSKISQVIKTIEDIAFEINLLALNASVEASRAGEHGKSFSVVADAVRALANRSSEAAGETAALIKGSIVSVSEGSKRASDTAESLEKIVENVSNVTEVVDGIQKSAVKQSKIITGITEGLTQVNEYIQQDAVTSEETATAAEELDAQVVTLQQKLSYFQTKASIASIINKTWVNATLDTPSLEKVRGVSGTKKHFTSGDIIVQEGDTTADSMFFLTDGHVEVFKNYGRGSELKLATLRPGDLFGEMSLFLDEPRSATIVAREKVEVLEVKQKNMYEFMAGHPDIAYDIATTLCTRLHGVLDGMDEAL